MNKHEQPQTWLLSSYDTFYFKALQTSFSWEKGKKNIKGTNSFLQQATTPQVLNGWKIYKFYDVFHISSSN